MKNFINIHTGLPAINHLCEYKDVYGGVSRARLVMDSEKPILFWSRDNGDSVGIPHSITSWHYVIENEEDRQKESEDWLDSLRQTDG